MFPVVGFVAPAGSCLPGHVVLTRIVDDSGARG
jgi:hypothetical protein